MSWTGKYWGKDGTLAIARKRFDSSKEKKSTDYCEYASVCYSAANRIFADIAHLRFSGWTRLQQGLALAKLSVELCDAVPLGTLEFMLDLNDQAKVIDIVCSVYSRYGFLCGGRANKINFQIVPKIETILRDCSLRQESQNFVAAHTQAFLHLHQLVANQKRLKISYSVFKRIITLLNETIEQGDLAQASRIAKHLSKILVGWSHKKRYRAFAVKWAREANSTDQLAKM